MTTPSFKNYPLSAEELLILNHVYTHDKKMNQIEVVRSLLGKISVDFNFYDNIKHFYSNGTLSLFGIFRVNPKDRVFFLLDSMFVSLRDIFARESGRTVITEDDFSEICNLDFLEINKIFKENYFFHFWMDNSTQYDHIDYNQQTKRWAYRLDDSRSLQRVLSYKDVESQLEIQWTRILGLYTITKPTDLRLLSVGSIFSEIGEGETTTSTESLVGKSNIVQESSDSTPDFKAIFDSEMTAILDRRWNECLKCIKAEAPMAAIVMMGGMLEATIFARTRMLDDRKIVTSSIYAPKNPEGRVLDLRDWPLKALLDMGHEIGWITRSAKEVGVVLRDYRNYIHPQKEHAHSVVLNDLDSRLMWQVTKELMRQLLSEDSNSLTQNA